MCFINSRSCRYSSLLLQGKFLDKKFPDFYLIHKNLTTIKILKPYMQLDLGKRAYFAHPILHILRVIKPTCRSEICWTDRGLIAQLPLQVSCLCDMHRRSYVSSKLKKRMCELCTISQSWSYTYTVCLSLQDCTYNSYIASN